MARRLFICTLFMFLCATLHAQSIDKRYRTFLTSNGMLHFIGTKKLTKTENLTKFDFDITYITGTDSATVNFSFVTEIPTSVKSCSLTNGHMSVVAAHPRMMFRDIMKRGYKIRTTTTIAFNDLQQLYANERPFTFSLTLENGASCAASFTPSQWVKEKKDLERVFSSIHTR